MGLEIRHSGIEGSPIVFQAVGYGARPAFSKQGNLSGAISVFGKWIILDGFYAKDSHCTGINLAKGADRNNKCSFDAYGPGNLVCPKDRIEIEDALAGRQLYAKLEDKGLMGIFGQNGQTGFVYKLELTTHNNAFDAAASMKFSHEHQNPLFIAMSTGPENG